MLRSVAFTDCALDDANLRHGTIESVAFTASSLVDSDFSDAKLTDVTFDRGNLRHAQFSHAKCERVDLRGARLEELRGAAALSGATIAPEQLVVLAPALAVAVGLVVKPVEDT
jgi:uncharacterized protein YjbI with pentapeptide repeats